MVTGKAEIIEEQPLWWIDECDCGVGTEVRLDPSRANYDTRAHKAPAKWRPKFCPNCGRKVRRG